MTLEEARALSPEALRAAVAEKARAARAAMTTEERTVEMKSAWRVLVGL
jgi:hypothetical protein